MTCASIQNVPKKGKLPEKAVEETPWNILCVDLIYPYKIHQRGEEMLILKPVTMINPVTGWFGMNQYNNKKGG